MREFRLSLIENVHVMCEFRLSLIENVMCEFRLSLIENVMCEFRLSLIENVMCEFRLSLYHQSHPGQTRTMFQDGNPEDHPCRHQDHRSPDAASPTPRLPARSAAILT